MKTDEEETKSDVLFLNSLLYFKNPEIGIGRNTDQPAGETHAPIQVAFPDGSLGLGLALSKAVNGTDAPREQVPAVVVSGPEHTEADIRERNGIKAAFIVLASINILITFLMFFNAPIVDLSNSNPLTTPNWVQSVFEKLPKNRTPAESLNFAATILFMILGMVSIAVDSVVGLSAYALGCLLTIFLGAASLPVYMYSLRYVFDIVMLYFALVQRSKLMFTYLPTHIHGQ